MFLQNRTILVVDDDVDICDFCTLVLTREGADVLCASAVEDGFRLAETRHPDLAVLDIIMEEADSGFKLATRLAEAFPNLPIIMLSSIAEVSSQVFDTSTLPIRELIEKPMKPDHFLKVVRRILEGAPK